jgi:hypothetical protein
VENIWALKGRGNGERRKHHNEELHDLYCSHTIVWVIKSRKMRWPGHVACMGKVRGVCKVLLGKPEGKRLLDRRRLDGKIILRRIFRMWGVDWIELAQDRDRWQALVNTVISIRVP